MEAPSDVREAKRRLRREHRSARRRRTSEEQARAAESAAHHGSVFASLPCVRSIVGYVASDGELDIAPLLDVHRRAGAYLFLPRVTSDGGLDLVAAAPGAKLEPSGPAAILQPTGPATTLDSIPRPAVLLAPAVALDRSGNRLGRGGGAYDRLLPEARRRGWLVVGVCHADQVVAHLPTEPHDVPVEEILTERGWISPEKPGDAEGGRSA